jgi:hypothetical protein
VKNANVPRITSARDVGCIDEADPRQLTLPGGHCFSWRYRSVISDDDLPLSTEILRGERCELKGKDLGCV